MTLSEDEKGMLVVALKNSVWSKCGRKEQWQDMGGDRPGYCSTQGMAPSVGFLLRAPESVEVFSKGDRMTQQLGKGHFCCHAMDSFGDGMCLVAFRVFQAEDNNREGRGCAVEMGSVRCQPVLEHP